jgi:hypothetical protein
MITRLAILFIIFLVACTTAMWDKPLAIQDQKDTYKFTIYLGGFSGEETAFAKLQYEVDKFQNENGYKNHKIIDKYRNLFPGHQIEYTVQFTRD